ncbi:MAG: methyltransferase domain-containing protein [Rhabdochlamydiaceae bacterium]|nr:methyltransferase domain-containing protein [Candidatus Amphrikana amoebophyrae]
MNKKKAPNKETSWQGVAKWYDQYLTDDGHYFHREIILPKLEKILKFKQGNSLLDVGCGQGILSRTLPKGIKYLGLDSSKTLIKLAQDRTKIKEHQFMVADATKDFNLEQKFSHAAIILALQNMKDPAKVIKQISLHLNPKGKLIIVLNHPCFRIPRQSSWEFDEGKKLQYRRVDRYMGSMEIPIQMTPSLGSKSPLTYSFHHSLSDYSTMLKKGGLSILEMHEWCSEKLSEGKRAKAENRCRKEFPMFLCFVCERVG